MSSPGRIHRLVGVGLALAAAGLYLPAFGRGFVSEDFLILRLFHEAQESGRFWALAGEHFTGPWLGISLVSFYRPLSSFFLQIEWSLFGVHSGAYWLLHLAIHLWTSWQLADLLRRLHPEGADGPYGRAVPYAAAGIFALYPLHPNTVVFVASFATLWAVAFLLLALRCFVAGRDLGAALAFVAALASYEQAAVLPALLLLVELLILRRGPRREEPWSRVALRHLPFWLLLAAYMGLRRLALGHSVGGYDAFRARLGEPLGQFEALLAQLGRIPFPELPPGRAAVYLGVGVALLALGALLASRRSARAAIGALGVGWIVLSLAPFGFVSVVPGNGRYAYWASCGLALALWALVDGWVGGLGGRLARAPGARARWTLGILLLVCGVYGARLWAMNELYARAGAEAEELRGRLHAELRGELAFVAGVPRFLEDRGRPAAQVFHWGLADALLPPFSPTPTVVYPLPGMGNRSLAPLDSAGIGRVLRLKDDELQPARVARSVPGLALGPGTGDDAPATIRPEPGFVYKLVVATRGAYHVSLLDPGLLDPEDRSEPLPVRLPVTLLDSMAVLYDRPGEPAAAYWWIEERRREGGALRAVSPPASLLP